MPVLAPSPARHHSHANYAPGVSDRGGCGAVSTIRHPAAPAAAAIRGRVEEAPFFWLVRPPARQTLILRRARRSSRVAGDSAAATLCGTSHHRAGTVRCLGKGRIITVRLGSARLFCSSCCDLRFDSVQLAPIQLEFTVCPSADLTLITIQLPSSLLDRLQPTSELCPTRLGSTRRAPGSRSPAVEAANSVMSAQPRQRRVEANPAHPHRLVVTAPRGPRRRRRRHESSATDRRMTRFPVPFGWTTNRSLIIRALGQQREIHAGFSGRGCYRI